MGLGGQLPFFQRHDSFFKQQIALHQSAFNYPTELGQGHSPPALYIHAGGLFGCATRKLQVSLTLYSIGA